MTPRCRSRARPTRLSPSISATARSTPRPNARACPGCPERPDEYPAATASVPPSKPPVSSTGGRLHVRSRDDWSGLLSRQEADQLPRGLACNGPNPSRERDGAGKFRWHWHEIDPGDGVYLMRELHRQIGFVARHRRGVEHAAGQAESGRELVRDPEMLQHAGEMNAAAPAAFGIGDHDRAHAEQ